MAGPLKVLVVDDHQMFSEGIASLLERRFQAVEVLQAGSSEQALAILDTRRDLDIALVDVNLPGISGFSLLQQMRESGFWTPVLVVSATQSVTDIQSAMAAGAAGFLCKEAAGSELIHAIETVIEGGIYEVGGVDAAAAIATRVTTRQRQVLHLVAQGCSNKTIASHLGISEHTVRAHLHDVFRLLDTHNRTACIREAERLGLIATVGGAGCGPSRR